MDGSAESGDVSGHEDLAISLALVAAIVAIATAQFYSLLVPTSVSLTGRYALLDGAARLPPTSFHPYPFVILTGILGVAILVLLHVESEDRKMKRHAAPRLQDSLLP